MTNRGKFSLYAAIGVLGGAAGFAIVELVLKFQEEFSGYLLYNLVLGASFGIMIGVFLGSAEGIVHSNKRKIFTGSLVGVAVGGIAGITGVFFGQKMLLSMLEKFSVYQEIPVVLYILIRSVSWAFLGMLTGMVEGIRAKSGKKLLYGVIGGFLGGLLGGCILEILAGTAIDESIGRIAGMVVLGGLIGIFYAVMERRFSPGVLRVLNGVMKDKKLALNQRKLTIGTSAKNDLALEYKGVEKLHAVISVNGEEVTLYPLRNSYSLKVNDEEVKSRTLKYEDVIKIGDAKFLFEVR